MSAVMTSEKVYRRSVVSHNCMAVICYVRSEVSNRAAEKVQEWSYIFHVEVQFGVFVVFDLQHGWSCCFAAYKPGGADHARA